MESRKDHVRCITIIHPLHEVRKYREFSAFFRMLGIFVCEKNEGEEIVDQTDCKIVIPEGVEVEGSFTLQECLNGMKEVFEEETIRGLQEAVDIFLDNNLMRASYAIAYFADGKKKYIYEQMYEAHGRFEKALHKFQALEKKIKETSGLKYILAAECNCKRRMNELYTIIWNAIQRNWYGVSEEEKQKQREKLWEKSYYSYEDIDTGIRRILEMEPDYYGAYVIRGFAAELDDDHRFDSVGDLIKAWKLAGEHSYASYLLYRIGKYYESIRGNLDIKWKYYLAAWQLDPNNYRALYKFAVKELSDGNLDRAEGSWIKILGILEKKKDSPALQPIECAYLVKTYVNLGNFYINTKKINEGIVCLEKAVEIYNKKENEDADKGFYPWMFGNQPENSDGQQVWMLYKEAAREKLRIKHMYELLKKAAEYSGERALYEKYYQLSLEQDIMFERTGGRSYERSGEGRDHN